jgi:hypothetical protein
MNDKLKSNAIKIKFINKTRVELDFDGDIAVVETPTSVSARLLAALVEANLFDLCGNKLHPRKTKNLPGLGGSLTIEQRHGIRLTIVDRGAARELVSAEDLEQMGALN